MGITKESSASLSSLTLGSRNPSKQFFDFAAEIVSTEFLYICVIWSISRDLSSSESWMMQSTSTQRYRHLSFLAHLTSSCIVLERLSSDISFLYCLRLAIVVL